MNDTDTDTIEFRTAYHDHVRRDVLPHIPNTGGKLLDLGGGIGGTAAAARSAGLVDTVGVADLVENDENPMQLDFRYQGNLEDSVLIEKIVAKEGKFDVILALDILEHLVDPWTVVERLHNSLKAGGYLVTSIPNIRSYRALLPLLLRNRWDYQDAGILDRTHLRFFVRSTAIDLTASSGLSVEKVVPSPVGGGKIRLFRKLTLGLLNSFTDRQYIVIARNEG